MKIPSFTVLGGGPTVLMLHGIGGGHLAFAPQVESLASAGSSRTRSRASRKAASA